MHIGVFKEFSFDTIDIEEVLNGHGILVTKMGTFRNWLSPS